MQKEKRAFDVNFYLDWSYGVSIEKIREDLEVIESMGATDIIIEAEERYGDAFLIIKPISYRIETDEEFECRLALIEYNKKNKEQSELKLLSELKAKYNQ